MKATIIVGFIPLGTAFVLLAGTSDSVAQISAPARPAANYRNSVAAGLSYGFQNERDADFWGWSLGYNRSLGGAWFGEAAVTWDLETEKRVAEPDREVRSFTALGTITYAINSWLSLTSGLGKGFASTDNTQREMRFESGDVSTGLAVGFATPGLPWIDRDSIGFSASYEYNFTQKETSLSFDVTFGWSF